jgi:hypothetical protein
LFLPSAPQLGIESCPLAMLLSRLLRMMERRFSVLHWRTVIHVKNPM